MVGVTEETPLTLWAGEEAPRRSEFFAGRRGKVLVSAFVALAVVGAVALAGAGGNGAAAASLGSGQVGGGANPASSSTIPARVKINAQQQQQHQQGDLSTRASATLPLPRNDDPIAAAADAEAANAKQIPKIPETDRGGTKQTAAAADTSADEDVEHAELAAAAVGKRRADQAQQPNIAVKGGDAPEVAAAAGGAGDSTVALGAPSNINVNDNNDQGEDTGAVSLSEWVLLHLPTLTTLMGVTSDPNDPAAELATFSMPRDLIQSGISDELLYRARVSKASEYGLDVEHVKLASAYYVADGHAVLSAKITCSAADVLTLRKAIATVAGVAPPTVGVQCGDKTTLGELVTGLNRDHKMYNITSLVPVTFTMKIGRYGVPAGESAVAMGKRVGTSLQAGAFLQALRADGMDVTSVDSVETPHVTADITFRVPRGTLSQGQVATMGRSRAAARAAVEAGAGPYVAAQAAGASSEGATTAANDALGAVMEANAKAEEAMAAAMATAAAA